MSIHLTDTGVQKEAFFHSVKEAVFICRAVNNKFSQKIINLLMEQVSLSVTEIFIRLRLLQSVTSQHLAILRRAGIVTTRRDGKQIYYELNQEKLIRINEFIENLLQTTDAG